MADTNINPVTLSSAVVGGVAGATVATNAKTITQKIAKMSEPIVDKVSVATKYRLPGPRKKSFADWMIDFIDSLSNSIEKGLKALKNFFLEVKNKEKIIKIPDKMISKSADKAMKLVKSPAVAVGIVAGALYAGYKIVSSQKEDK